MKINNEKSLIECGSKCNCFSDEKFGIWCDNEKKEIYFEELEDNDFPEWCPLPDAKEGE